MPANLERVLSLGPTGLIWFNLDETTSPGKYAQINIGDAFHLHVVQRKITFDVSRAGARFEIGLAEIRTGTVKTKPNFSATVSLGELDMNIIAINGLLEQLDRLVWLQADFHSMVAFTKSLH